MKYLYEKCVTNNVVHLKPILEAFHYFLYFIMVKSTLELDLSVRILFHSFLAGWSLTDKLMSLCRS